jgi:hypothetical protein
MTEYLGDQLIAVTPIAEKKRGRGRPRKTALEPAKTGDNKEDGTLCVKNVNVAERGNITVSDKTDSDIGNQLIESLDFSDGKNSIKILLSKRSNRMYRIQVVLNGDTEIRNSTFTGSTPALAFWKLLKNSLKK